MVVFTSTLQQMLMMFILIAAGYVLRKCRVLPENSHAIMSRLETYIFIPALNLHTQMSKCNVTTFSNNWTLIVYGLALSLVFIVLSKPAAKLFVPNATTANDLYLRNIYRYSLVFGNYGFMGNYIILGVWGSGFFFKYGLFCFFISILCSSWGLYILIPKDQNAGKLENLKKGLLTPPVISLIIGICIGLMGLGERVPAPLMAALEGASQCQGPVAMLLAGFVIGGYNVKEMLLNKKVYIATAVRLLLIPSALMIVLSMFGVSKEVRLLTLIAFGTPLGLNTIVYPSAYGGDPKTGASMAMVSHTLSVATIPVLYYVFFVLVH